MPLRPSLLPLAGLTLATLLGGAGGADAQSRCTYLQPIGGDGRSPIVAKQTGPGRLLGKTNWNTDFIVDQPYASYVFWFTANSSDANATYPVSGYMKFTDGTSLRVFEETVRPGIGGSRRFGPFPAVPGKQASQMNFKVGSEDPSTFGYSYRIGVQGCRW